MTNDTQQGQPLYSEHTAGLYFRVKLLQKISAVQRANGSIKMQCNVDPTRCGVFPIRSVRKGEINGRFGARLLPADSIEAYVAKVRKFSHQVHRRWYVRPENADEISRIGVINHCCEPNVGHSDALTLVTMQQ
ncbi:hypothetical protein [Mesorhizobium sp. M0243]|uniref:hypothetical protein n=1 Tax=Mesorhizobium sp. M0243 TaxID=2956925 RepID=UPI003336B6AC